MKTKKLPKKMKFRWTEGNVISSLAITTLEEFMEVYDWGCAITAAKADLVKWIKEDPEIALIGGIDTKVFWIKVLEAAKNMQP